MDCSTHSFANSKLSKPFKIHGQCIKLFGLPKMPLSSFWVKSLMNRSCRRTNLHKAIRALEDMRWEGVGNRNIIGNWIRRGICKQGEFRNFHFEVDTRLASRVVALQWGIRGFGNSGTGCGSEGQGTRAPQLRQIVSYAYFSLFTCRHSISPVNYAEYLRN